MKTENMQSTNKKEHKFSSRQRYLREHDKPSKLQKATNLSYLSHGTHKKPILPPEPGEKLRVRGSGCSKEHGWNAKLKTEELMSFMQKLSSSLHSMLISFSFTEVPN